jgi:hypothetical protein
MQCIDHLLAILYLTILVVMTVYGIWPHTLTKMSGHAFSDHPLPSELSNDSSARYLYT